VNVDRVADLAIQRTAAKLPNRVCPPGGAVMLTLTLTLAACSPPGPFTTVRDTGALSDTAPSDSGDSDFPPDTDVPPIDTDPDSDIDTDTDSDIDTDSDTDVAWTDPQCEVDMSGPHYVGNWEIGIRLYMLPGETCMSWGNGAMVDLRYWTHRFEWSGTSCTLVDSCVDVPFRQYGYIESDSGAILYLSSECDGDVRDPGVSLSLITPPPVANA
jgi:hypothetical protein